MSVTTLLQGLLAFFFGALGILNGVFIYGGALVLVAGVALGRFIYAKDAQ